MTPSSPISSHPTTVSRDTTSTDTTSTTTLSTDIMPMAPDTSILSRFITVSTSLVGLYILNMPLYMELPSTIDSCQSLKEYHYFNAIKGYFLNDLTELKQLANTYTESDDYNQYMDSLYNRINVHSDNLDNDLLPLYQNLRRTIHKLVVEIKQSELNVQEDPCSFKDQQVKTKAYIKSVLIDILPVIDSYSEEGVHSWIACQPLNVEAIQENKQPIESIKELIQHIGMNGIFAKFYEKAVLSNDPKTMYDLLLTGRCDLKPLTEITNSQQLAPLSIFALNGFTEGVEHLLKKGDADVNHQGFKGLTALHLATLYNRTDYTKQLLASPGIQPDKQDKQGCTPLLIAAYTNSLKSFQLLVDDPIGKTTINTPDKNIKSPLIYATIMDHVECVKILLNEEGIDVNCLDVDKSTPLQFAAYQNHTEILKLILASEEGKKKLNASSKEGYFPLLAAAESGANEAIQILLSQSGIHVNETSPQGNAKSHTALHQAVVAGHLECVKTLLQASGIDCNPVTEDGYTPLHFSVMERSRGTAITKALLAKDGIRINMRLFSDEELNATPLNLAALSENPECMSVLIAYQRQHPEA